MQWLLVAGVLGVFVMQGVDFINFSLDDVFISLRYAVNASQGEGLVYNAGEYVEGYSNFLWVMLLAAAALLVKTAPSFELLWIAKALSAFFALFTLLIQYRFASMLLPRDSEGRMFALVAVLLTAASASFVAWAVGGLETMLYSMLLLLGVMYAHSTLERAHTHASCTREAAFTGLFFALAALTRPEAPLYAGVVAAVMLMLLPSHRRIGAALAGVVPFILVMGVFLLWRWQTYGDIVPNTYYAKTYGGGFRWLLGMKYWLGAVGSLFAYMLPVLPLAWLSDATRRRTLAIVVALLAANAFFVIYSGGDWMPGNRFLVPLLPLVAILAALGLHSAWSVLRNAGLGTRGWTYSFVAVLLFAVFTMQFAGRESLRASAGTLQTGWKSITAHCLPYKADAALWIRDNLPPDAVIATGEAGIIGYLNPGIRLIDLNGLMHRDIARMKYNDIPLDIEYLLNVSPDAVVLLQPEAAVISGIVNKWSPLTNARFRDAYTLRAKFGDMLLFVPADSNTPSSSK